MSDSRQGESNLQAERAQLEELRNTHRQRLYILQRQAAQFGRETPAHIQSEIEETDKTISKLNAQLGVIEQERWNFTIEPEALTPVTIVPASIGERLVAVQRDVAQLGYQLRREVAALHKAIGDLQDNDLTWKQLERDARVAGQQHNYRWLVAIGLMLVLTTTFMIAFIVYFLTLRSTGAF
jgi:hypothetical protein